MRHSADRREPTEPKRFKPMQMNNNAEFRRPRLLRCAKRAPAVEQQLEEREADDNP